MISTPFGSPVEPEVKITYASASGAVATGAGDGAGPATADRRDADGGQPSVASSRQADAGAGEDRGPPRCGGWSTPTGT